MSTETSLTTQEAEPTAPDAADAEAGQTPPPSTEHDGGQAAPDAAATPTDEDVYDQAFSQFLDGEPDAGGQATPDPDTGTSQDGDADGQQAAAQATDPTPPQLDDAQQQLLSRLHMTPEMIAHWTPEQQQAFLANAAKREADQTRSFKELREQLQQQGGEAAQDKPKDPDRPAEAPPASALADEARQVVDELVDVYGEEMKPLGDLTGKLVQTVGQLESQLNAANQRLDAVDASAGTKDRLLVEMTIDAGVRDLMADYPSLGKSDARSRVVERFTQAWRDPNNPHRTGQGPLLDRVRAALKDAAAAEFHHTESAAQVALANKTKDRLRRQPQPGAGRGRKAQPTEDDIYAQAFDEHLKSET